MPTTAQEGDSRINEVQYNPIQSGSDSAFEWVELFNATEEAIVLSGWSIRDNSGRDVLPPFSIAPGSFAVIAATADGFRTNFPEFSGNLFLLEGGTIGSGLNNDGDHLILEDGAGNVISAVSYGDDTSYSPHGPSVSEGHSLERLPAGSEELVDNSNPTPGYGLAVSLPTPTPTSVPTPKPSGTPRITYPPTSTPTDGPTVQPLEAATGPSGGVPVRAIGIASGLAFVGGIFLFRKWRRPTQRLP